VQDPPPIGLSFLLIVLLDALMMPLLFLIAGLFAWPSYNRKGFAGFLDGKVRRLFVPFVLCTLLFSPIMPFIRQSLRAAGSGEEPLGFWRFWLEFLAGGTRIITGSPDTSTEIVVNQYWFLALLFMFFVGFAVHGRMQAGAAGANQSAANGVPGQAAAGPAPSSHAPGNGPRSRSAWLGWIAGFTLVVGLAYAALCYLLPPNNWVTLGGLWQVQPTKVPIYLGFFMAGVYIGRRRLLPDILGIAGPGSWSTVAAIGTIAYLATVFATAGVPDASPALVFASRLLRLFLAVSAYLALLTLFHGRVNRETTVWRELASNSYNIYLIHMTPLVVIQLLAIPWPVSSSFKFVAVSLLTLLVSYVTSRFLVNKSAAATVAAMGLLFMAMCLVFV
jgi:hypothetical protein